MDTNHDGQLSKEKLIAGYQKIVKNQLETETLVKDIVAIADTSGNNKIDYREFLIITCNRKE